MNSLVVFDLDGTLIDSCRDLAESTNEMLGTYGAPPLPVDAVTMMVGEGAKVLVRRALATAGLDPDEPDALARFRSIYDRRLLIHTRPYDGIIDVLRAAAPRAALAMLSNKPEAPSRKLLDAFDLSSSFQWVIGGDSGFPRKPDPASLEFLMSEAHVTTDRTLFVGDSMIDVETAHRAHVHMCVVRYGFGHMRGDLKLSPNDLVAETPADVGLAIEEILRSSSEQ